ncbi:neuropeptide FF receptor 2-like [Branchiostoma lanceolatum]|uniref:neuropeptide FF receptor 2-like n=1 Tax=Branchiostoma lanceolatum TaxID=7740 RepID=UPI003453F778
MEMHTGRQLKSGEARGDIRFERQSEPESETMNNTTRYFGDEVLEVPVMKHSTAVTVVIVMFFVAIILLSIVGNALVGIVVGRNQNLRSATSYFIVNLALSDLMVTVLCMPVTLVNHIFTGWRLGELVCKLTSLQGVAVAASAFTLVVIAVDRYRAVMDAMAPKLSGRQSLVIVSVIWVLSFAVMVPHALVLGTAERYHGKENDTMVICKEWWQSDSHRQANTLVVFLFCYLFPLLTIAILYIRIIIRIGLRPKSFGTEPRTERQRQKQLGYSDKKVTMIRMLILVVVLFALSWLPYHLVILLVDFKHFTNADIQSVYLYAYPVVHWLGYCNSTMNPILYGYCNRNFRKEFQALLGNLGHDFLATETPNEMPMNSRNRRAGLSSRRTETLRSGITGKSPTVVTAACNKPTVVVMMTTTV